MEAALSGGTGPAVRVFPDRHALSHAAADTFRSLAGQAVSDHGRFAAALSGGSTPQELYALLAEKPYRDQVAWERIHLFWADERCVPREHAASNFRLVKELLLSRVPVPEESIHRIAGESGADRAATTYERELRTFFGRDAYPELDLVILGVGEDGHTASLFPGASQLGEQEHLAVPVFLGDPMKDRVTLTLPVLAHARQVLFLAAGLSKRKVVRSILAEGNPDGLPAGLVRPVTGDCTWFLDREAASQVPHRKFPW